MRPSKLRFIKQSSVDIFIVRKIEMKTKVLEAESTTECVNRMGLIRILVRIEIKLGECIWERVLS